MRIERPSGVTVRRFALATLCSAFVGCGAHRDAPRPEDPLAYLRVGVDPAGEAERSIEALSRAGFLVGARLDGETFVAIDATRRRDGASVVRVFTSRGVALGLDAPDARHPERARVALRRSREPFDLDGAPGEELAIDVELGDRACVALVRIAGDGAAREIAVPLAALPGGPCIERLADVAGDGRPELLASLRLEAGLEPAPTVPYLLGLSGGRAAPLAPALGRAFYVGARASREAALGRATPDERLGLGVELAALALLEGRPREEAVAAFDRVAAGVEGLADAKRAARAAVTEGLGLEPGLDGDGVLDAPP